MQTGEVRGMTETILSKNLKSPTVKVSPQGHSSPFIREEVISIIGSSGVGVNLPAFTLTFWKRQPGGRLLPRQECLDELRLDPLP